MKRFLLTVLLLTGCGADEQSTPAALLPCAQVGVAPFDEMGQPAEVTAEQCREYYGCDGQIVEVDGQLMIACNK